MGWDGVEEVGVGGWLAATRDRCGALQRVLNGRQAWLITRPLVLPATTYGLFFSV